MPLLFRGLCVALVLSAPLVLTPAASAKLITASSTIERQGSTPSFAGVILDDAMKNAFEWTMANGKIQTACRTGRSPFPAFVAQMSCGRGQPQSYLRQFRSRLAFAGFGGGGGGGTTSARKVDDLSPVPLPASVLLFGSALSGLAIARRRARSRC